MSTYTQIRFKLGILWVARSLGVFAVTRWLTASQLRVLCYHGGRIGDEDRYNAKLFCSTAMFEARIDWLQGAGFDIVGLAQAVATPQSRRRPLSVVLTFDDGWYSTGRALLPVLAKRKLPATLYLCTQHFVEAWPVLNVAARYILWKSSVKRLRLDGFGPELDGDHVLSDTVARDALVQRFVHHVLSRMPDRARVCAALEMLGACAGVTAAELDLASRRFDYMNGDELRAAADAGCAIELHGHVHSYPYGEPERFRADLAQCDAIIRAAGLPKPGHYCYPSGRYDAAAATILADSGVVSATTCVPGLVGRMAEPGCYYLPRFLDGDSVDMLEFQAEMSGFTPLVRAAWHWLRSAGRRRAGKVVETGVVGTP